jgi:Uma2 family endonuclease
MYKTDKKYYTIEEYLELEAQADYKSEYYKGEIFRMSGGTANHSRIKVSLVSTLNDLVNPCEVFDSDMQVRTAEKGLYTYPDASVVCDEPIFADERQLILTNPIMLIEVLSDSTRSYDKNKKFKSYRQIPTLCTYLLIEQDEVFVACYQKQADGSWNLKFYDQLSDVIKINQPKIELPLNLIYHKVIFPKTDN